MLCLEQLRERSHWGAKTCLVYIQYDMFQITNAYSMFHLFFVISKRK